MTTYNTKVLRASNVTGLAKAKDLLDEELARVENDKDKFHGTIAIEMVIVDGGTCNVKRRVEKNNKIVTG